MKILFLAANPVDAVTQLRIDEEFREITQGIHMSPHSDQLEIVSEWAVRTSDLQVALLKHKPNIVHFSGHGSPTGEIILEDETGSRKVINRNALSDLFRILKHNIRLVVLNACYAKEQAQALTETVDFTIGMSAAIEDRAAKTFATHFYKLLALGSSLKEAFDLAINQLAIEGINVAQTPELLERDGANASDFRIVEPSRRPVEMESRPCIEPEVVAVGKPIEYANVPANNVNITTGGQLMRGAVGVKPKGKHHSLAFLLWLFASIAISLITDVLRRFLGGDSIWPDIAATIVQAVLIVLATLATILFIASLVRPANSLAEKAPRRASGIPLKRPKLAAILTVTAFVIALGLWLSLPVMARYYNERGIGFQYHEHPDLSRARESYQQAVRLKPNYAQAHYNLAIIYEDLQPEKAMEEYLFAIRYDSYIYPAYNNLARLYLIRGKDDDYERALNILSQAGDLSPQDESVQYSLNKNLGWANYALKRYSVAEMYLRKAISLRNDTAAAHCLLAYVLKEQGKAGVADECFDCVTLAPGEKDVEPKWVSDAQEYLMKGGSK